MGCIIHVPEQDIIDAINDDTKFNQQEKNADMRHDQLMCLLKEMNDNMKNILMYLSIMLDQEGSLN